MSERTQIVGLQIDGYRSIRSLSLSGLGPAVVLHGKKGSGKSNILRAVRLAFDALCRRWAHNTELGDRKESRVTLPWDAAQRELGFRSEDLHRHKSSRVRIQVQLELDTAEVGFPLPLRAPDRLRFDFAVVLEPGQRDVAFFVEHAEFLFGELQASRLRKLKDLGAEPDGQKLAAALREPLSEDEVRSLPRAFAEFERGFLRGYLEKIISWSDAYRSPAQDVAAATASPDDVEEMVFLQLTSPLPETIHIQGRLERLLGRVRLFGSEEPPRIRPVTTPQNQRRVHIHHPVAGDLPLTSLGTGEQQIFLMLARRVLEARPVTIIEEPEAHLHVDLMRSLSLLLQQALTADQDVPLQQLWLATHHHLFAIAPRFVEVRFEEGQTHAQVKDRARAGVHFYEPGPLWGALQSLLETGLDRQTVMFRVREVVERRAPCGEPRRESARRGGASIGRDVWDPRRFWTQRTDRWCAQPACRGDGQCLVARRRARARLRWSQSVSLGVRHDGRGLDARTRDFLPW